MDTRSEWRRLFDSWRDAIRLSVDSWATEREQKNATRIADKLQAYLEAHPRCRRCGGSGFEPKAK